MGFLSEIEDDAKYDVEKDLDVGYHLTDLGNAKRMVAAFGENFRYIANGQDWYIWDGTRFKLDETHEIDRIAEATVRRIHAQAESTEDKDRRAKITAHALKSESDGALNSMVARAAKRAGTCITPDALDAEGWYFNVLNGTIDLRTGELRKHSRPDLITKISPIEYDPEATCPVWIQFLHDVLDWDEDLEGFIQRAVGYSLTAEVREEVLFFLHGSGRNGKTTFINVLHSLFGEYAEVTQPDTLMRKKEDGEMGADVAILKGARLVTSPEVQAGAELNEAKVKDLTSTDHMRARFLYAKSFRLDKTWAIWMYGNHLPEIEGTDEGIWRRLLPVPFNMKLSLEDRDLGLADKLRAELPGILAWAVRGSIAWQSEGLGRPKAVIDKAAEYRESLDVLGSFLEECTVPMPTYSIKADRLYREYSKWAKLGGQKIISQTKFGIKLRDRGMISTKNRTGRHYLDLGFTDPNKNQESVEDETWAV